MDRRADTAVIEARALGLLMPMFLWVSHGIIRAAGPTIARIMAPVTLPGSALEDVFGVRARGSNQTLPTLARSEDPRLWLHPFGRAQQELRGIAVPVGDGADVLINLSFGIGVMEAVRHHGLTHADFSPTDLAVEMLFLVEAKTAVMDELRALNDRLRGAKSQAEAEALTDPVTGLGNRRAMDRALSNIIATGNPFALIQLDLDFFKQVNDSLGHAAGDHVLREVGKALTAILRVRDHAARVGGDEFIIILEGMREAGPVTAIAQRIADRIGRPLPWGNGAARVATSLGGVLVEPPAEPRVILEAADRALYAAKRAGRGRLSLRRLIPGQLDTLPVP